MSVLKVLLGISMGDPSKDALLEFALQTVEDRVLSYINHEILPKELEGCLVLMTVSYWKGAGLGNEQPAPGAVTGVKRGDVAVSFSVRSGAAATTGALATAGTFGLGAAGGFFGWQETLNGYRRMRR